jgi:hypothetical protein
VVAEATAVVHDGAATPDTRVVTAVAATFYIELGLGLLGYRCCQRFLVYRGGRGGG